jgi:hypothetical protein
MAKALEKRVKIRGQMDIGQRGGDKQGQLATELKPAFRKQQRAKTLATMLSPIKSSFFFLFEKGTWEERETTYARARGRKFRTTTSQG